MGAYFKTVGLRVRSSVFKVRDIRDSLAAVPLSEGTKHCGLCCFLCPCSFHIVRKYESSAIVSRLRQNFNIAEFDYRKCLSTANRDVCYSNRRNDAVSVEDLHKTVRMSLHRKKVKIVSF